MIGYEINNDFQTNIVGAANEQLEFLHTVVRMLGDIGIYIIIVFDGVRTSCHTLHHRRVVGSYTILGIICLVSMLNNTCVPNMSSTKALDLLKGLGGEVNHSAATVLVSSTAGHGAFDIGAEESGQHLIYDNFRH